MSEDIAGSKNLKAGEFYGRVPQKRVVSSLILSEVFIKARLTFPNTRTNWRILLSC